MGPGVRWWNADLTDPDSLKRVLDAAEPETVFHLAGITSAARGPEKVLPILYANLVTTVNLLVATIERPVRRLLLAGSLEEPQPDGSWPVPSSPYAAAKSSAAMYARMCHALYRTPVVSLRLFMVYGPAQPDVSKLVPYVIRSLLLGESPALSTGMRAVDWVYVDDVVDAFLAAATADNVDGETFDVGSGQLTTVREIVERLAGIIDAGISLKFGVVPERALEQVRVADVVRIADRLGWRAQTPLDRGLQQTVDWHRSHDA
jgi:UDP-glucose 4-epimerase